KYDTLTDLAGITRTATSSYILVVPNSLGVKSVRELIALAKAKPGQLNFASAGVGSGTHFAGEIFKAMAGIDVVHVPFKGIPESLTETITGRVQFFMAPIANAVNLVREGKLTGLAVSSAKRDVLLPDLPPVADAVPGYESILWFGLLTASGVPRPVVNKLNAEITRILRSSETYERFGPIGMTPRPMSAEEFDALIRNDVAVFSRIAREANIKAEENLAMDHVAEKNLAAEIAAHLRERRQRLTDEIRAYPTPIPRCDAQFNHLYEQLGRLSRDLDAIEGKSERAAAEAFLATQPYTDDKSERDFRARVAASLR